MMRRSGRNAAIPQQREKKIGRPQPARGFILVAVLIVVMLASMVVVSLLFRVRAEETAAVAGATSEQAWGTAMSGVYEAMRMVAQNAPGSLEWRENPALFREHLLFDDGADRWYFSIYSQNDSDSEDLRFGVTDEASKLNINEATEEMFEKLPKMTPYLAQGLLDFLDDDDRPRPEGAEQEYYDSLPIPYAIANGPLATLEELLLVRGFTPALLFGEDANLSCQLNPNEDDGELQFPPDNKDGKLDFGLRPHLTVSSYELNLDNSGSPRIDLNDPAAVGKLQSNADELPPSLATYLEALHRNKVVLKQPADLLEARRKLKDGSGREVELESGIGKQELPVLLDRFTTRKESRSDGLINLNTSSSAVLKTVPGIDEALADSIVAARRNLRLEQRRTPAWLYEEGLVDAEQFKAICPYLTARAFQYHLQVVGYCVPSGRYRVLEVIIDTAGSRPAITYLRDITRLGLPFRIETPAGGEPTGPPSPPSSPLAREKAFENRVKEPQNRFEMTVAQSAPKRHG